VAEHERYFERHGVQVTIRGFDSGKASLAAMLSGEGLDMCTVAQTPIMLNSFYRRDFMIVSMMVSSFTDVKVVCRRDRGITLAGQLEGKRVGITVGSTGQYVLYIALLHAGKKMDSVEVVDMSPSELPPALAEGRVDAIVTWEPHAAKARRLLGEHAVVLDTGDLYREDFYFVAMRELLDASPEAVVRFLGAVHDAQQFIREKEDEAKAIVAHRLGLDPGAVNAVWDEFNFGLGLDQTVLLTLENEARWAVGSGIAEGMRIPNYLNYVSVDGLKQVDPGAVRLTH